MDSGAGERYRRMQLPLIETERRKGTTVLDDGQHSKNLAAPIAQFEHSRVFSINFCLQTRKGHSIVQKMTLKCRPHENSTKFRMTTIIRERGRTVIENWK